MRFLVLYGSQTGTAQDVAEQIWRESKRLGFSGPVLALDEYSIEQLIEEQLVVFVVATTGNGDEPDNMKSTWKFLLRRSLPLNSLQRLQFACLGLGDSSYDKFNYAAKKLNNRLMRLGASALCPIGLCDDQHDHGFGAVSLDWTKNLWSILGKQVAIANEPSEPVAKWQLNVVAEDKMIADVNRLRWPYKERQHQFVLCENKRVTTDDHFQDVRLLCFNYSNGLTWQPGDIIEVQPCNSDALVHSFFELVTEHKLDFKADTVVQLSSVYKDMPLPLAYEQSISVALAAKYIWDLSARPRQRFFELLAQNCKDELELDKLMEFTTAAGLEDLINYVNRPRRTLLEVLQDFRQATSRLTLPVLFEMMPTIQRRSFSIASDAGSGNTLDLLVAVVNYKTKLSTPRLGLCSNWLKDLRPGSAICGAVKRGTMVLPSKVDTPLIMVGPGTGIAPFRSILQNRLHSGSNATAPLVVFFGCRSKTKDFFFSAEFQEWQKKPFVHTFFAFSRDQDNKIYVQDRIKEAKELLYSLVKCQNAFMYVAGSSNNMPKAVKEALVDILDGDADFVEKMIKTKRYQAETWS